VKVFTSADRGYWTYVERSRLSAVLRVLPRRNYDQVLDVGCGKGEFLAGFCEVLGIKNPKGVDGSPEAVKVACDRGIEATLVNLNDGRLPFESSSQSLVLMIETIEHLEDVEHCLDEIRRVLTPEGHLLITTPNLASWHGRISLALGFQPLSLDVGFRKHYGSLVTLSGKSAGHIRGFTKPALADMLNFNGFHVKTWASAPAVATGGTRTLTLLRSIDRFLSRFPETASHLVVLAARSPDNRTQKERAVLR
jgi:SAM-dependent methyltransferase